MKTLTVDVWMGPVSHEVYMIVNYYVTHNSAYDTGL